MASAHHRRDRAGGPRRCGHVSPYAFAEPSSTGYPLCREQGQGWAALMMCVSCGWVACSDDSPNQHGRAHYRETDHPVAVRLPRDSQARWCYVHERDV